MRLDKGGPELETRMSILLLLKLAWRAPISAKTPHTTSLHFSHLELQASPLQNKVQSQEVSEKESAGQRAQQEGQSSSQCAKCSPVGPGWKHQETAPGSSISYQGCQPSLALRKANDQPTSWSGSPPTPVPGLFSAWDYIPAAPVPLVKLPSLPHWPV